MATPPLSKKFMLLVACAGDRHARTATGRGGRTMLDSSLNFLRSPPGAFSASSSFAPLRAVTVNDTVVSVWFSLKSCAETERCATHRGDGVGAR